LADYEIEALCALYESGAECQGIALHARALREDAQYVRDRKRHDREVQAGR
jgi:hypothetical protein